MFTQENEHSFPRASRSFLCQPQTSDSLWAHWLVTRWAWGPPLSGHSSVKRGRTAKEQAPSDSTCVSRTARGVQAPAQRGAGRSGKGPRVLTGRWFHGATSVKTHSAAHFNPISALRAIRIYRKLSKTPPVLTAKGERAS